ncbi:alpha-1,2-fucosyltransferase [Chondrinema litorale]|uniref:alpha-1,2-fucosyltransferase n=1 Tax=Chondrinema litorale TaxID=2994555 RepID=UPI0025437AA4|nr:alpha-1,2-fucosyltransferase [Chondrinema litorale]UZR92532.1 alpha-1,2-fucosyltransferase [Chondrinema litorale]
MIGVFLDGRMGNHMFQYAFVLSLSKQKNTIWFVDQLKVNFILPEYFELNSYSRIKNTILTKLYHLFFKKKAFLAQEDKLAKNELVHIYYKGFFQSLSYFKEHSALIKKNFQIREKYIYNFQAEKKNTLKSQSNYNVIHIRLTDYKDVRGEDLSLPIDYYKKAIGLLENEIEKYPTIVLSDDIKEAQHLLKNYPNFLYSKGIMINDFQWISNAKNVIISNSSFAWWAAFLNNQSNNKIIAPYNWMGYNSNKQYPKGISEQLNWTWL